MKKYINILIITMIIITACSLNNTPTSKIEDLLSRYQMLDKSIEINTNKLPNDNINTELNKEYNKIISKQYRCMNYEIKDEEIDGNKATVTTEIEVLDYKSIYDKYDKKNYTTEEYNKTIINELKKVKNKITYTIDFNLTKNKKGTWEIDDLNNDIYSKLLGIY